MLSDNQLKKEQISIFNEKKHTTEEKYFYCAPTETKSVKALLKYQ
jgi:hypothetical protein